MTRAQSFDDALDSALDALRAGERLPDVLVTHAAHAEGLRPLLYAALAARGDAIANPAPAPHRLFENFSVVRDAMRRSPRLVRTTSAPPPPAWWQRRLTFASLSLPVGGVALLAFAGIGGAAAAFGGEDAISAISHVPSQVQHAILGEEESQDSELVDATETAAPSKISSSGNGPVAEPTLNRPTDFTAEGTIGEISGNSFDLLTPGGDVRVTIDGKTFVVGVLATGATATVDGVLTATKNLHAESVLVTADPIAPVEPSDAEQTPPRPTTHLPKPDETPEPPPSHTPDPEKTTGRPATKTPDPESTNGPPANHMPPGQGLRSGNPPGPPENANDNAGAGANNGNVSND
jgi:hypothetical protein